MARRLRAQIADDQDQLDQDAMPLVWFAAFVLTITAWAFGAGMGCGTGGSNNPTIDQPPHLSQISTTHAYVRVEVYDPPHTFKVFVREDLQNPPIDVTQYMSFAEDSSDAAREWHHGLVPVPAGQTHEFFAEQMLDGDTSGSIYRSGNRRVTVVVGPEAGRITGLSAGTAGQVVSQPIGGAVARPSPHSDMVLLFGETQINGSPDLSATLAFDLAASYFDEAGSSTIQSVLPLVTGESEVEFSTAFVDGSFIYAYYWRTSSSTGERELGLARTDLAAPGVFTRLQGVPSLEFPSDPSPWSLFLDGELAPSSGAVVSGSHVYLYGVHQPGGPPTDEVFVARAPLNALQTPGSYEFWDGADWGSAATPSTLWTNSGPPSVAFNAAEDRWVATSSVQQGLVLPYGIDEPHSAIAIRVAQNLEGPWTPPLVVWERPQTDLSGAGSAVGPTQLPDLVSGSTISIAATDAGDDSEPTNVERYSVDLSTLLFAPALTSPGGVTNENPFEVTGFVAPGDSARLFVNGQDVGLVTPDASGTFSEWVILEDGPNAIHAQAERAGATSESTPMLNVDYQNNIDRTSIPGVITEDTVWTPGQAPGITGPYIIGSNLTIDPGATLIVQPGVEVHVDGGHSITVAGGLVATGVVGNRVVFRSDTATGFQEWTGFTINGQAVFDHVDISNTGTAITVLGGDLQLTDASLTEFTHGVRIRQGGTGHVGAGTIIDNAAGFVQSECVSLTDAGAVTIDGIEVKNCRYGLVMVRSDPDVQASTFSGHGLHGIWIKDGSAPDIHRGTVVTPQLLGRSR